MKIAAIFNTCGISGRENAGNYITSIRNILDQDFDDFKVAISSCKNNKDTQNTLKEEFGDSISYNFINEPLPVNVTFNHTCQKMTEAFGDIEGYLYIDSGIDFGSNKYVLKSLYDLHKSGPYGITASRTDTDSGTFLWFNEGKMLGDESGQDKLFEQGHLVLPVGKAVNAHCQIYDKSLYEAFDNRVWADIFASECSESVLTFCTAAVGKKFVVHKDIVVSHAVALDGASSGFKPHQQPLPPWQHLFKSKRTIPEIIADPEALESGFGYEECQKILMHDETKYTEEGFAKDPERLKSFILENMFIPKDLLDYNNIFHKFVK